MIHVLQECQFCNERHPLEMISDHEKLHALAENLTPADTNRTAKSGGRSKGNDGYLTPDSFLAVVRQLGAIELDPAGSAQGSFVKAAREYLFDGLVLPWKAHMGALVYCNPPYSETRDWIEKADAEFALHMSEIVMLVAARTETIAVQGCRAKCICFWKGRITFIDPTTKMPPVDSKGKPAASMFPSMVLFWSLREKRIREVFEQYGKVVRWA